MKHDLRKKMLEIYMSYFVLGKKNESILTPNLNSLFVIFVAIFLIFSCSGKQSLEYENKLSEDSLVTSKQIIQNFPSNGRVRITGNLQNVPQGIVVLSQYTESSPKVLDTLNIQLNGDFSYDLDSIFAPTFYELNLYGKRLVKLALFNEDVSVNINLSDPNSLQIEGSQDSKEMLKLGKLMETYQFEVNQLNELYYAAMGKNDAKAIKQIQLDAMALQSQQEELIKEWIGSMGNSFASLAAIALLSPEKDFQFMDELIDKLNESYPGTNSILQMKQQLNKMKSNENKMKSNENCRSVVVKYLNSLGVKILFLNDEGYRGGVCQGGPGQYCGRVEKFYNGKYWAYDIVVFTEKDNLGNCTVKGSNDNLN
jgi:hypothetical protein